MNDDLVKRLREVPSDGTGIINGNYWCRVGELTHQAANRIEQLEAALRPFAAAADTLDKEGWDNLHIEGSNADVTGEHCRVARAALEGKYEQ